MKWNEMKWNEMSWIGLDWNKQNRTELNRTESYQTEFNWTELNRSKSDEIKRSEWNDSKLYFNTSNLIVISSTYLLWWMERQWNWDWDVCVAQKENVSVGDTKPIVRFHSHSFWQFFVFKIFTFDSIVNHQTTSDEINWTEMNWTELNWTDIGSDREIWKKWPEFGLKFMTIQSGLNSTNQSHISAHPKIRFGC
jgi:hypothetical protein